MKFLYSLIFCFCLVSAFSQTPQVPTKMEFAGIKLRIHESGRKDIQESVDALTRSQTHYNAMIEKARSYFPIIERIFKEENLPTDFKYLVLQESALIPDAVSSSDAVGYWQFKDFTAIEVGLRVDRNIDERMNIVAATRAAATYLKKNNSFFDNWLHALQAYQMGAGGAMRVLKDEAGVKSMTIDKKTYWYVRKFLAHKVAYENVVDEAPQLKLGEYTSGAGKNLHDIAKEVNVSEEEIEVYNKWLRRGRIPNDRSYTVIIPSDQFVSSKNSNDVMASKEADYENEDVKTSSSTSTAIEYTFVDEDEFPRIELETDGFAKANSLPAIIAKANDKVAGLAANAGVSLSRFLKYNDIDVDHHVRKGEVFYLKKKRSKGRAYYHILQPNESLWEVSQKYAVRLNRLQAKNRIREDDNELKAGRVIWLRYVRPDHVPIKYIEVNPPKEVKEVVSSKSEVKASPINPERKEDELKRKVKNEQQLVKEIDPDTIEAKKELQAHVENKSKMEEVVNSTNNMNTEEQVDSVKHIHSVSTGETYYAISKQYNARVMDLLAWNQLNINDKLAIGQKLIVYEYDLPLKTEVPEAKNTTEFDYYVVKPGDTLYKIAKDNNMTVEELMKLNEKSELSLNLGEKIKVKKLNEAD